MNATTTTLAPTVLASLAPSLAPSLSSFDAPFDEERSHLSYGLLVAALLGVWCCAVCISTKGCRDCHYRDHRENDRNAIDDPVWASPRQRRRQVAAEDYRLAVELQRQEAAAAAEAAATARREWIEQLFNGDDDGGGGGDSESPGTCRTIPKIVVTAANLHHVNATPCPICLSDAYREGDVLCCGALCHHVFHQACIQSALIRSKHCPVCRQVFLAQEVSGGQGDDVKENDNDDEEEQAVVVVVNDDDNNVNPAATEASLSGNDDRRQEEEHD